MKYEEKIAVKPPSQEREIRAAAALRENLRRRKAQQESRALSATSEPGKD